MARKFKTPITIDDLGSASSQALAANVDGDSQNRINIDAGGKITWGSGSATGDTTLYRSAADTLKTDDAFTATSLAVTGQFTFPSSDGSVDQVITTNGSGTLTWSDLTANATVSDTAPSSPTLGQMWYESDTGKTFVYYDSFWIEVGASPPSSPFITDLDEDTKIQVEESADEDKIRFDTAGSERMIIDSTGNVGIGTTSPAEKLHIKGDGAGLRIEDGSATDHYNIFRNDTTGFLDLSGSQTTYSGYTFNVNNGTQAMKIDNSGNLTVGGDLDMTGGVISNVNEVVADVGSATDPSYTFDGNLTTGMYLYGTDRLGLSAGGTWRMIADAGGILVNGAVETYYGTAGLPTHSFNGDPQTGMYRAAASTIGFSTGGTARLTINSVGKVGIGTTGPVDLLDVGDASTAGSFRVHASGGSESFRVSTTVVRSANIVDLTTASAANVFINTANNTMYRSTSSLKYKTAVETLENEYADIVFELRPVWYRSITGNDPEDHSYYGLIAEEVAEVDPRLVHFGASSDCGCVADEDGHIEHEQSCLTEPEGVFYERLVPHLINVAQRQQTTIDALTARIQVLEAG